MIEILTSASLKETHSRLTNETTCMTTFVLYAVDINGYTSVAHSSWHQHRYIINNFSMGIYLTE
jgi:hypothetical protein